MTICQLFFIIFLRKIDFESSEVIIIDIGEKIKQRRLELGWSQQELADRMGYTSKSTITRIEKGINDVAQKNIEKFAKVLNVSIAYLMDWDEEETAVDSLTQKHLENYAHLNQEWKDLIDELIKALQEEPPNSAKILELIGKISLYLQS